MVYMIILISSILVLLIYLAFLCFFYKSKGSQESSSAFECGFNPYSLSRMTFSYRFFLISILFIIFDVEISLMLPIPFLMGSMVGIWVFVFFVLVLIVGLLYEYFYGSLDWLNNYN